MTKNEGDVMSGQEGDLQKNTEQDEKIILSATRLALKDSRPVTYSLITEYVPRVCKEDEWKHSSKMFFMTFSVRAIVDRLVEKGRLRVIKDSQGEYEDYVEFPTFAICENPRERESNLQKNTTIRKKHPLREIDGEWGWSP